MTIITNNSNYKPTITSTQVLQGNPNPPTNNNMAFIAQGPPAQQAQGGINPQQVARAVEDRDIAIEQAGQLSRQIAQVSTADNLNGNLLNQLNVQYAQAQATIDKSNLTIATAGGGTQRQIAERFARLQRNSLGIIEGELERIVKPLGNNFRAGLVRDMLGEIQGERFIYNQLLNGANLPTQAELNRNLNNVQARIRRNGLNNEYAEARQIQGDIFGQMKAINILNNLLQPIQQNP